ncbi:MAG TPA: GNAT family N-acetyltransferase [Longilinea sp.]|nr:GNAT family N-acetyltransferase [Longilinea sp.]
MLKISRIQPHQYRGALEVFLAGSMEIWQVGEDKMREWDEFVDFDDMQGYYLDPGGTFLVLTDNDRVVATGGLKVIDSTSCLMKRLWMYPQYRGKGWGRKICEELIAYARAGGWTRMELMIYSPKLQEPAYQLYLSLGFKPVRFEEPDTQEELLMEMEL